MSATPHNPNLGFSFLACQGSFGAAFSSCCHLFHVCRLTFPIQSHTVVFTVLRVQFLFSYLNLSSPCFFRHSLWHWRGSCYYHRHCLRRRRTFESMDWRKWNPPLGRLREKCSLGCFPLMKRVEASSCVRQMVMNSLMASTDKLHVVVAFHVLYCTMALFFVVIF